jgi:homoserine dehydrogenase
MRTVRIGLLGLGVVGSAVARAILAGEDMAGRSGVKLEVRRVAVRDLSRKRSVELPAGTITVDPFEVVNDPEIDIVVEVMGGENPAFDLISSGAVNCMRWRLRPGRSWRMKPVLAAEFRFSTRFPMIY